LPPQCAWRLRSADCARASSSSQVRRKERERRNRNWARQPANDAVHLPNARFFGAFHRAATDLRFAWASLPSEATRAARAAQTAREDGVRMIGIALAFGAHLVATAPAAEAQAVTNFYSGSTLSIIVGSEPGGGHDLFARVFAKSFGRHIPGNPAIVVQDMSGANGLVAANYVANAAPRDGSVIGAISPGNITEPLLQTDQAARFDPRQLQWIGNIASIQLVCATWITSPVKTIADARNASAIVAAGSPVSSSAIFPRVMNELLGTKFKVITGYQPGDIKIAVERGEVDGVCGWGYTTLLASDPDWLIEHKLNFLAQSGLKRMSQLPDVPLVSELAADSNDQAIFRLLTYRELLGRPYFAPPGVPADRVAVLRKAFADTMKDDEYIAEAKAAHQDIDYTDHTGMEQVIADAYAMPADVVKRVSQLTRSGAK
jgi:tripartite-type tricarboxylate transporter receptor subunit TctC